MKLLSKRKTKQSKSKKYKKTYPPMKGGFTFKKNAKQWIREKDVDQAIFYPDRKHANNI